MPFNATHVLVIGSIVAFAIWVWRFSSVLRRTPRYLRAAALRGSATAMGTEFWNQGNPHQNELGIELGIDPNSIVHTLRWPNAQVEILSFQEARRVKRGRIYHHSWIGYRFSETKFPGFDLKPAGVAPFMRRGWWGKVSLPGQVDFESRFVLTGDDVPAIESFFTSERCKAILSVQWPRAVSIRAGGAWLLAHHEQLFNATSQSDSEANVSKETLELSSLVAVTLPLAAALSGSKMDDQTPRYVGSSQASRPEKRRPWWDRVALLFSAIVVGVLILVSGILLGLLWERLDR